MFALTMMAPAIKKRDRRNPVMPRKRVLALLDRVMGCTTMKDAALTVLLFHSQVTGQWRKDFRRLGLGLLSLANGLSDRTPFRVFIPEGNDKLEFVTWGVLPLYTCPGMGECRNHCYSMKTWRHTGPLCRQLQNTLLLTHRPEVVAKAFAAIPQGKTLRLYVDGDFRDFGDVAFWMGLLRQRPDVAAYGYSKSWVELWAYHIALSGDWPNNYLLNLSSGGNERGISREDMLSLPITRGDFIALDVDYCPLDEQGKPIRGNVGFARYDDPAYRKAVRKAAKAAGLKKFFVCPGRCGPCALGKHACGNRRFQGIPIINGIH